MVASHDSLRDLYLDLDAGDGRRGRAADATTRRLRCPHDRRWVRWLRRRADASRARSPMAGWCARSTARIGSNRVNGSEDHDRATCAGQRIALRRSTALARRCTVVQRLLRLRGEVGRPRRARLRGAASAWRIARAGSAGCPTAPADRVDDARVAAAARWQTDSMCTPTSSAIATFHCNDMVVDSRGAGLRRELRVRPRHQPRSTARSTRCSPTINGATLARVDPDGSVHAVADGSDVPERHGDHARRATLIVAESFGRRLTAFDIAADGIAVESAGVGRPRAPCARRDLPRRRRRDLGGQPAHARVLPRRRGRRDPRCHRHRRPLLRVHARRPRQAHAVHADVAVLAGGRSVGASHRPTVVIAEVAVPGAGLP